MSAGTGLGHAIEVRRDDITLTREVAVPAYELVSGEVRLRVDCFALTANNMTYAALGEAMGYWRFFPASEDGWGRVPAFGFAEVDASACEGVLTGARIYGYLPMATHLVVTPQRVSADGFTDGAAHRSELPGFYNSYLNVIADPGYDAEREAEQMLLRPQFATAFLIDDALADAGFHGASAVLLSSASSKTAYATAFLLAERGAVEVIGLTSASNASFVRALGCYDRVVTYDEVAELDPSRHVAYVDMSGDGALRARLHHHLGDALHLDLIVGATHHSSLGGEPDLPGVTPTMFFAPGRGKQREAEWGAGVLQAKVGAAWGRFVGFVTRDEGPAVLSVVRSSGPAAIQVAWSALASGRARPGEGQILAPRAD